MSAQQPDGTYRGRALECEGDGCGASPTVFVAEIVNGYAYPEMGMRCNACADPLDAWHGHLTPAGDAP